MTGNNPNYRADDIRNAASWARYIAAVLEQRALWALNVRPLIPPGNLVHAGRPKGHIADPTGQAATARIDPGLELDQAFLRKAIGDLSQAAEIIDQSVNAIVARFPDPDRHTTTGTEDRKCEQCGVDPIHARVVCAACYAWLDDHKDANGLWPLVVPAHLIERRLKNREARKQAEQAAMWQLMDVLAGVLSGPGRIFQAGCLHLAENLATLHADCG